MRKTERAISPGPLAPAELPDQMPEFIDEILPACERADRGSPRTSH